jgi:hypothetical protein
MYSFSNGTCSNITTASVTINALPTVIWSNTLTNQCASSTTYGLTGGSPTGGTYSGTGVSGTNFDAATAGVGTWTLTYTYSTGNGCANTATNTITVFAPQPISGLVRYWNNNTPLGNVTVTIYEGNTRIDSAKTSTSGSIGTYSLSNVCPGKYNVTCSTTKETGGINSTDAAQVNSWYVDQYAIEKVRAFAGDVVTDDYLNSADAGKIVEYFITNGDSTWKKRGLWTFWRSNDMILNDAQLNTYHFPEVDTITVPETSSTLNIYGLCTGDFNGSFTPNQTMKSASNTLSLTYGATLQATTGEEFDLPIYTQSAIDVGAVSLILNFPSDKLEIIGVKSGDNTNTPLKYKISGKELRIGWFSGENLTLKAGDKLLTLRVKLTGSLEQNETVRFTLADDQLNELADALGTVISDAVLNIDLIGTTLGISPGNGTESLRFTNYPNPFAGTTTLAYSLPADGIVAIELRNTLGVLDRVVLDNVQQTTGDYKLVLDASDIPDGIYIATLKLNSEGKVMTKTIKIVRTN